MYEVTKPLCTVCSQSKSVTCRWITSPRHSNVALLAKSQIKQNIVYLNCICQLNPVSSSNLRVSYLTKTAVVGYWRTVQLPTMPCQWLSTHVSRHFWSVDLHANSTSPSPSRRSRVSSVAINFGHPTTVHKHTHIAMACSWANVWSDLHWAIVWTNVQNQKTCRFDVLNEYNLYMHKTLLWV